MSEATQPFLGRGYPWAPANIVTGSRFYFAVEAARRIRQNKPGATYFAAAAFATDFVDGKTARFIERLAPGSGWGETTWGKIEHAADPLACVVVGSAVAMSKDAHPLCRTASGLVVASESLKSGVAGVQIVKMLSEGESFSDIANYAEQLDIPFGAKLAETEKMVAVTLGALTCELSNPVARRAAGGVALGLAAHGSFESANYNLAYGRQLNNLRTDA